jgi:general secretion pathway protein C
MSRRFFFPRTSVGLIQGLSVLVWAVVAFSAVTWGLKWLALGSDSPVLSVATANTAEVDDAQLARALGSAGTLDAPANAASAASRYQLVGVAHAQDASSVALISVDGQPAKPFRIGQAVGDGWVLQHTQARRVSLGASLDAAPSVTLELPPKK